MNVMYQRAFHALLAGVVTVKVKFEDGGRKYTYRALESLDLKAGDSVVVNVRGNLFVTQVIEVNTRDIYDAPHGVVYKWIVQKVDTAQYDGLMDREKAFEAKMEELAYNRQKSEELRMLREELGDEAFAELETAANSVPAKDLTIEAGPYGGIVPPYIQEAIRQAAEEAVKSATKGEGK